jgi:hypothetical protein
VRIKAKGRETRADLESRVLGEAALAQLALVERLLQKVSVLRKASLKRELIAGSSSMPFFHQSRPSLPLSLVDFRFKLPTHAIDTFRALLDAFVVVAFRRLKAQILFFRSRSRRVEDQGFMSFYGEVGRPEVEGMAKLTQSAQNSTLKQLAAFERKTVLQSRRVLPRLSTGCFA